jgi:hypothetical protein
VLSLPIAAANLQVGVPILPSEQSRVDDVLLGATQAIAPEVESEGSEAVAAPALTPAAPVPAGSTMLGAWDLGQVLFGAWAVVAFGLLVHIAAGALSLHLELEGLTPELAGQLQALFGKVIALPAMRIRIKGDDIA